jgi:hypothetical protein
MLVLPWFCHDVSMRVLSLGDSRQELLLTKLRCATAPAGCSSGPSDVAGVKEGLQIIGMSGGLSVCPSAYLYVCLSVCLSVRAQLLALAHMCW